MIDHPPENKAVIGPQVALPATLFGLPIIETDEVQVAGVGNIEFGLPTKEWAEQAMREIARMRREFQAEDATDD